MGIFGITYCGGDGFVKLVPSRTVPRSAMWRHEEMMALV